MGLDASTSTIGISIIDYEDGYQSVLVWHGYYKPIKTYGPLEMFKMARDHIWYVASKWDVDDVVIEDYIKFMKGASSARKGASSASTIIPLAILNTTIRLGFLDKPLFGTDGSQVKIHCLNVMKIRHSIKLSKELPKKENIPELVAHHLNIPYPWLYKINRRTKREEIMVESYDEADSMAVALAWAKIQMTPKKVSRAKVKDTKDKSK
jgi:hypothetical protein